MISYFSETEFDLTREAGLTQWLANIIIKEDRNEGDISYIFCNDEHLLEKNIKYLNHNTLTDIIGFDYTMGNLISGDIFISVDRVKENAIDFKVSFEDELHRVMAHGVLHFCGYKDKTQEEKRLMREKEDYYLSLRAFL